MKKGIRVIKRDHADDVQATHGKREITARQSDREIADTVKNWIGELAQRKRAQSSVLQQFRSSWLTTHA